MKKRGLKAKDSESDAATIVFRPGAELGKTLGELATQWIVSRGEAAKRLVALAIHELDLGYVVHINALMDLAYGGVTFDGACHQLHVVIDEKQKDKSKLLTDVERLSAVQQHIEMLRMMRGVEKKAEQTRLTVRLERR